MFRQIVLVGNLGSDPEMRYTPAGVPVANFSLAVNKSWANAQGERQSKTTWFRITVWRKQAELASQFLKKGRRVLVVGEVEEANVWTDREGTPRSSLDVTAQFVKFMDSGHDEETAADERTLESQALWQTQAAMAASCELAPAPAISPETASPLDPLLPLSLSLLPQAATPSARARVRGIAISHFFKFKVSSSLDFFRGVAQ